MDKCPHNNDQPIKNCLDCIDEKELYQQLEIIHEYLFQSIPNKETDLTEKQQQQLNQLLAEYNDLFDISGPGKTNVVQHEIDTGNSRPIALKPYYRRSPLEKEFIQNEIDRMLKQNIISPSNSPWSAPVVVAKKKDRKFWFCVDYR